MALSNLQRRSWFELMDGTMPEFHRAVEHFPILDFIDATLRGFGQVVFMNNPATGSLILAAMCVASPWLGVGGTIGALVSTGTAVLLGLDRNNTRDGLHGFNGVLVGAAMATFLQGSFDPAVIVWIVLVSAFSTVLMSALSRSMSASGVSPLTLPFNFATLIFFFGALDWTHVRFVPSVQPRFPAVSATVVSAFSANPESVTNAIFRGIGQLFFANSVWSGVLIIIGILLASRIAVGFALAGSIVGMLTGLALGADGNTVYNGLWGFNSFAAAMAVGGIFFVSSSASTFLAIGCAIAAAFLFGAISTIFAPWGLPALTLPFCFATLAFVLARGSAARLVPVAPKDVVTPEEHLRRVR